MFCKQFSPLRYRIFGSLEKGKLSFKRPSPKPHSNRTGSVFALRKLPVLEEKQKARNAQQENTKEAKDTGSEGQELSALSPGNDLPLESAIRLHRESAGSVLWSRATIRLRLRCQQLR